MSSSGIHGNNLVIYHNFHNQDWRTILMLISSVVYWDISNNHRREVVSTVTQGVCDLIMNITHQSIKPLLKNTSSPVVNISSPDKNSVGEGEPHPTGPCQMKAHVCGFSKFWYAVICGGYRLCPPDAQIHSGDLKCPLGYPERPTWLYPGLVWTRTTPRKLSPCHSNVWKLQYEIQFNLLVSTLSTLAIFQWITKEDCFHSHLNILPIHCWPHSNNFQQCLHANTG